MLRARAVEVRAGGRALLHDASLAVAPGEFVAVIGPNGAGKSTLLGALAGDRRLAGGSVELDGRPLAHWRREALARRRAVLPQHSAVAFDFSARQVASLGLLAYRGRVSDGEVAALVTRALEESEAIAFADRSYTVLSGGERQRVQLARVLVQCDAARSIERTAAPGYLLLDEPIAGLDLAHQHAALASARRRATVGVGVLAVLHDLNMAMAYADRAVIVERGRLTADGAAAETLEPERLSRVFATPIVGVVADGRTVLLSPGGDRRGQNIAEAAPRRT